jgi:Putative phage metallopeptidase
MKTYSAASRDLESCLAHMFAEYHLDLTGVTVGALFVFDEEGSEPVLKHQGYPAAAVVRITPLRDRALGMADAIIVVDRACWLTLAAAQRNALIDHELYHLERVRDEETGRPKTDALDRPKLALRRHDHQLGWFDEIARRHGSASPEMRQAKQLLEQTQQLYFDFGKAVATRAAAH